MKISYLGHSGYEVLLNGVSFVFDYCSFYSTIDEKDFAGRKNYIFSSHSHMDHYDRRFHVNNEKKKEFIFVLGDFQSSLKGITVKPREQVMIEDVLVTAGASRDLGACFLVQYKGLSICHLGDNANWEGGDVSVDYRAEIDFLCEHKTNIDLLFLPICDYEWCMYDMVIEGFTYAIETLKPKYVFPMHSNGKDEKYLEFSSYFEKINTNSLLCCPKRAKDSFDICL